MYYICECWASNVQEIISNNTLKNEYVKVRGVTKQNTNKNFTSDEYSRENGK